MKLATFEDAHGESIGAIDDDGDIVDLTAAFAASGEPLIAAISSMVQLLQAGDWALDYAREVVAAAVRGELGYRRHRADVHLLAPVPRPPKILCVGRNYRDHVGEMGAELPPFPSTFAKLPSNVIADGDAIVLPSLSRKVDFEAELAVVIGRRASHVSKGDALSYVAGFTILNDVSARDVQIESKQLTLGKNFRTFAPLGPWLTTPDEVGDAKNLGIRLWLNNQLMQSGNTHDLIFETADIIAFLSDVTDLEAGDVISTGTPGGVGAGRTPPVFLKAGDVVTIEIDHLGRLENPVVEDAPGHRHDPDARP
jgi:acylpyruvate hydrolase